MADDRMGHIIERTSFPQQRENDCLLETVCLKPFRNFFRPEEKPYPPRDLTKDLCGLPPREPLLNGYLFLAQGRLQNYQEEWWTRENPEITGTYPYLD